MRQVMVRYKVKPDRVEENEELVRAVYEELDRVEPAGLRYATYRLEDGVSFMHVAMMDGESPLGGLSAFQRFQASIKDRCDEPPAATGLHAIGSYRL